MKYIIWIGCILLLGLLCVSAFSQVDSTADDPTAPPPSFIESLNLAHSAPSSRIVNGIRVRRGERPFQIALHRSGRFICGGSLLNRRYIVTAAHCCFGQSPGQFQVRFGTLRFGNGSSVAVERIHTHPGYTNDGVGDDIALLRLAADVNAIGPHVGYVEVNSVRPTLAKNEAVTVSGWGRTARDQTVSEYLLKASLKIVDFEECSRAWASAFRLTPKMICAADRQSSACHGDSGGPLTLKTDNTTLQVGVVSLGAPTCHSDKLPNVYTNVYHYRDWIRRIIGHRL